MILTVTAGQSDRHTREGYWSSLKLKWGCERIVQPVWNMDRRQAWEPVYWARRSSVEKAPSPPFASTCEILGTNGLWHDCVSAQWVPAISLLSVHHSQMGWRVVRSIRKMTATGRAADTKAHSVTLTAGWGRTYSRKWFHWNRFITPHS